MRIFTLTPGSEANRLVFLSPTDLSTLAYMASALNKYSGGGLYNFDVLGKGRRAYVEKQQ